MFSKKARLKFSVQAKARWAIRPELVMACYAHEDGNTFGLVLHSGPVELDEGKSVVLRVKLDADAPDEQWWTSRSDYKSYTWSAFQGERENFLVFIKAILGAKAMLIEVRPFMTGSVVVIRFDVSGLRRAMDRYPECRLPTQLAGAPK